jgi:hypothetical protein
MVDKSSLRKHRTLRHSVGSPQLDNTRIDFLFCTSRDRIDDQATRTIAKLIGGHVPSDGTLGGLVGKLDVLRIECPACSRQGRYHVARLLDELGPGYRLTNWLHERTADCPQKKPASSVRAVRLWRTWWICPKLAASERA